MVKKSSEEDLVEPRVRDAFEAAANYGRRFIGFLDPAKAQKALRCAKTLGALPDYEGCGYRFFGGYGGAERVYFGVFPPFDEPDDSAFPVAAVELTWKFSKLSHRDFLGALLSLGIVRDKLGDIIVGDGKCTVIAEKTVAMFIVQNLERVGSAGVRCEIANDVAEREEHFKEIGGTVASARLDCVVSVLTGKGRAEASTLIAGGLVSVDFDTRCERSFEVSGGATVSIRGHGRFVIDSLGPPTRKGRLNMEARKYL